MINFENNPKPNKKHEHTEASVIPELAEFSDRQIKHIDQALNKLGLDFQNLGNLFDMAHEDKIDLTDFLNKLSILSKTDSPIELRKCISDWQTSL